MVRTERKTSSRICYVLHGGNGNKMIALIFLMTIVNLSNILSPCNLIVDILTMYFVRPQLLICITLQIHNGCNRMRDGTACLSAAPLGGVVRVVTARPCALQVLLPIDAAGRRGMPKRKNLNIIEKSNACVSSIHRRRHRD